MENFRFQKICVLAVLFVLAACVFAANADAKMTLRKPVKKVSPAAEQTVDPASVKTEPEKKANPVAAFFTGLVGKKKEQKPDVPLPSTQAVPSSTAAVGAERVENFEYKEEENVELPFAPSYGVDRTASAGTAPNVPDVVILEDAAPAENAVSAENAASKSSELKPSGIPDSLLLRMDPLQSVSVPETETAAASGAAETAEVTETAEIAGVAATAAAESEETEETTDLILEETTIPAVPTENVIAGMDPNDTQWKASSSGSAKSGKKTLNLQYMEEPRKSFSESVSPQRLAAPDVLNDDSLEQFSNEPLPHLDVSESESLSNDSSTNEMNAASETHASIAPSYGASVQMENRYEKSSSEDAVRDRAVLKISTQAPESMLVGTQTEFRVQVTNESACASEGTCVEIEVPEWLVVRNANVKSGSTELRKLMSREGQICIWDLGTLNAAGRETLILTVLPSKSAEAELHISWSNRSTEAKKVVSAEAPKLEMKLLTDAPLQEGTSNTLNLHVLNTGNCVAKNIVLKLNVDGFEADHFVLPGIRRLLPGEEQVVPVEILPQTHENLKAHADAFIQNQLLASADETLEIEFFAVDLEMPQQLPVYVGMESRFPILVRNSGNKPAEHLKVSFTLPEELRFLSSSLENYTENAASRRLEWEIGRFEVGETKEFYVTTRALQEGNVQVVAAVNEGVKTLVMSPVALEIQGISSLRMTMDFPQRTLPVTEEGVYEITLTNTGSRCVEDAKLYVFFAEGLEPLQLTDTTGSKTDAGVVYFQVPPLMPNEVSKFTVRARANDAGNFPIRVQVVSEASKIDLIQQDTTIFR